jgi:hypothetical protein
MRPLQNLTSILLDELVPDKPARNQTAPLAHYITKLARLGGYLARAHDPPPGWRGMSRLTPASRPHLP